MWKKIEKSITLCCAALLVVIATVSGTLAYESMVEQEIFVAQNDHRIDVQLLRQGINADGEYVDMTEDPMLVPLATGYTENIIRVKNNGNIDTFNRVIIAVPADLDESLELVKGDGWTLEDTIANQTCDGELCNLYIFTMDGSLKAETISDPAILGVRVDAALEQHGDTYILNDVIYDYSEGLQLKIVAQAVQSAFFESPENAFEKGGMAENPWAPSITLNSPVSGTALNAVLRTMPTGTDITTSVTNVIFGKRTDYGHIMETCYGQPVDDTDPNGPWAYYQASTDEEGNTNWTIYILSDHKIMLPGKSEALFSGMSAVQTIDTTVCDTSHVWDMSMMFTGCTSLTSVIGIEDWDTSSVETTGAMFQNCPSLLSLDLSKWDVSSVKSASSMFSGCSALELKGIENWNTESLQTVSNMFRGCASLTALDLNNWNTSSITDTSYMFINCTALKELKIDKWDTSNFTNMREMFSTCIALETLDTTDWDVSGISSYIYMFFNCKNLTHVDASGWVDEKTTDISMMFHGCHKLESIDTSEWDTSNVKTMSNAFNGCKNLTSLDVTSWDTANVTSMHHMFYGCSSLETLDVDNWDTSKVTTMSHMFYGCHNLTTLNTSNWHTSNVIAMDQMFHSCYKLQELDTSKWNASKVTAMEYMFVNCSSLKNLDLSGISVISMTDPSRLHMMFSSCSSLETIYVSGDSGWESLAPSLNEITMFSGCSKLVGGAGTKCTAVNGKQYGNYARIDGGTSSPGYFTQK